MGRLHELRRRLNIRWWRPSTAHCDNGAMRFFDLDRCRAESGHLIAFDRSPERTWEERIYRRAPAAEDAPVTVWGM